jgi:hypothetical protein
VLVLWLDVVSDLVVTAAAVVGILWLKKNWK